MLLLASAASAFAGYRAVTHQSPAAPASAPATSASAVQIRSAALSLQPKLAVSSHLAEIDTGLLREMQKLGAQGTVGLFVHFSDQDQSSQDAVLKAHGATVVTDFRKYTDALFVRGSVANMLALASQATVYRLEWNEPLQLNNHTANWAIRSRVAQERVQNGPYFDSQDRILDGSGVGVVVIDSGVDGRHPDMAMALNGGRNYKVTCPIIGACPAAGFNDLGTTGASDTSSGHGMHVAGTILGSGAASLVNYPDAAGAPAIKGAFAGVATKAKLYAYGTGEAVSVLFSAQSYQHILDNFDNRTVFPTPIRVTNNSYGNAGGTAYSATNTLSQLVKRIVTDKKVVVVFAAGNDGDGTTVDKTSGYCKDPTPGVICVASYDDMGTGSRNGVFSDFSSQGALGAPANYPDVAAPGTNITSTCTASLPICKDTGGNDKAYLPNYGTISGTSMATPHTVGAIALLLQAVPNLTPVQVEEILQNNARKVLDNTYGANQAAYEPDPQNANATINYRAGAGLIDVPRTLDALSVRNLGSLPTSGEYTVISGDANAAGAADSGSLNAVGASDIVKLTMQDDAKNGVQGITYRITVSDASNFRGAAYARYQVLQNVDGKAYTTSVTLKSTGLSADGAGINTNAPATYVALGGNVLSFFVPLGNLGAPAIGAPIHNIRINAHNNASGSDAEVDYAPSRTPDTDNQTTAPGWGRPYTVLNQATPIVENRCEVPGLTLLNDGGGDATTTSSQDLLSANIAQPFASTGNPNLVFTIKVADLNTLSAGSGYYLSFNTPAGFRGVRMEVVNPTAPAFYTYTPSAGQSGGTDGRFADTQVPAAAGSKYDAATGVITIIATPSSVGLTAAGDQLEGFNGGVTQSSDPGVGIGGATLVTDEMPNGLGRVGSFAYVANAVCAPNTAPIARLTADKTSGSKALTVAFSGLASSDNDAGDSVKNYSFTFGDNSAPVSNSTGSVSHTYTTSGTYTTTLKVNDSRGLISSNTDSVAITVINHAPTADLTANKTSGSAPLAVNFSAVGADDNRGDVAGLLYSYDFDGDNTFEITDSASKAESFTFHTPGSYTARVQVKDSEGLIGSDTLVITVSEVSNTLQPFTFIDRTNVRLNTYITSEVITPTGYTGTLPISISGAGGQYRINDGVFTDQPGQIKPGDRITVRHVSATEDGMKVVSTVTVGEHSTPFASTTTIYDRVPDAFDFGTQDNLNPGAEVQSVVRTLTGIDAGSPIFAGPGVQYRINGGAYTSARGTLQPGQTLQVKHTTNTAKLGYTKTYLKVGGVTGYFVTRTKN